MLHRFSSGWLFPLLTSAFCLLTSDFSEAAERLPFLLGADVSLAPSLERAGVVFKDAGKPTDIYWISASTAQIASACASSCIRTARMAWSTISPNQGKARWFFDRLTRCNVPFDLIGLSDYPFYKGTLADLRQTLDFVARTYHKPVAVVETAYLAADDPSIKPADRTGLPFPLTPQGRAQFLQALVKTVRDTPDHLGVGVLYWYPESVPVKSLAVDAWHGGDAALFDSEGNALPAFAAFGSPSLARATKPLPWPGTSCQAEYPRSPARQTAAYPLGR